jgi:hypothetical protein
VLDPPPPEWQAALARALDLDGEQRHRALAELAAAHPRYLEVWAQLATDAADPIEAYAYARVGYHRGLDALRGSGWHGTGYVRWSQETNHGFLASLDALRRAAAAIGEVDEEQRCAQFLRQLDPDWRASS